MKQNTEPEIIVMLTRNDVTVPHAHDCFAQCADLPAKYWGFKDNGLSRPQMERLVRDFLDAGKTPVLEVVNFDAQELENAAALAVDCGVQYFTGSRFSETVMQRTRAAGMQYFPFCGQISGPPIGLDGSAQSIAEDARRILARGASGVDLVAWRHSSAEALPLAHAVVDAVGGERIIMAGSINSTERLRQIHGLGVFACTMGGALFEGTFAPGGTFRDNLEMVLHLKKALLQEQAS